MFNLFNARAAGRKAAEAGESYTACPYPLYALLSCVLWHEGWDEAMNERIEKDAQLYEKRKYEQILTKP
jgi:ribosome modulation factor